MRLALVLMVLFVLLLGCIGADSEMVNESVNTAQNKTTANKMTDALPHAINISRLSEKGLSIGSEAAPVIMVEFSDYQCQFCRRFWEVNFKALKEEYIDSGKVQFVYRDFPLDFHNAALDSALAVACAEDQGMGWQMHDKIFAVQSNVSTGLVFYAKSDLRQWGGEVGLDMKEYDECIASGKYGRYVNESRGEAVAAGFNATPSFVIGLRNRSNYVTLTGALPYGTFRATIDQLLNKS